MFLAIEIGGTKLQLAVGQGGGLPLIESRRFDVVASGGAAGILRQIEAAAPELLRRHRVTAIGGGFGGPVASGHGRATAGRVLKSHHVAGWDGFPLADWCREKFSLPTAVGNDCDVAALAEARFGAGQGHNPVFYVTVGTGIGGGMVIGGEIYQGHADAAAEIGHLRYGLDAARPEQNLESLAAGWGIAKQAAERVARWRGERGSDSWSESATQAAADLEARCGGQLGVLSARIVAEAARQGNIIALEVLRQATTALGWAVAQVITLLSPEVIVVGGGVSLLGEDLFFAPLRSAVANYVFPPLQDSYEILAARLGEEVVLHGALTIAASAAS
jgi:glucokinase